MALELNSFHPGTDLSRVLALQQQHAPVHRHWQSEQARQQLCDVGRAGGRNVVVAWLDGRLVGVAGWVDLGSGDGEFYGAPVLGFEPAVATLLLDRVEVEARRAGAEWVRVSAWPEETVKAAALAGRGYRVRFDFIELAAAMADLAERDPSVPHGLTRVGFDAIDPARYADLFNECFRDVPNAPRMSPETAASTLAEETRLSAACQLGVDAEGRYQAFSVTQANGYVDAFGVRLAWQGRGIATAMMAHTIAAARAAGLPRLTSTVASTNSASLALHHRFGFAEVDRCQVWQRDLTAPQ